MVGVTGLSRRYAAWLLRSRGKTVRLGQRWVVVGDVTKKVWRRRRRVYDEVVQRVLRRVWVIWDDMCGKRLAPMPASDRGLGAARGAGASP